MPTIEVNPRIVGRRFAYAATFAAGAYAIVSGAKWLRYGKPKPSRWCERDELLDCFMPVYDVVERHQIRVEAPASSAFAAACEVDLDDVRIASAIFKARELILGGHRHDAPQPGGLLPWAKALGWRVLMERPDREVVLGAATRPWEADVTFRPIPPDEFAPFDEPGYVKIAWTLRVDPLGEHSSLLRTETRAIATDVTARVKFRRYWAVFSPGIVLIRRAMLKPIKRAAEQRAARDRLVSASTGDLDPQC